MSGSGVGVSPGIGISAGTIFWFSNNHFECSGGGIVGSTPWGGKAYTTGQKSITIHPQTKCWSGRRIGVEIRQRRNANTLPNLERE